MYYMFRNVFSGLNCPEYVWERDFRNDGELGEVFLSFYLIDGVCGKLWWGTGRNTHE